MVHLPFMHEFITDNLFMHDSFITPICMKHILFFFFDLKKNHLGFRLQSSKCTSAVEMWKKLQHANVVQLREVFTTKSFNDQCKLMNLIY